MRSLRNEYAPEFHHRYDDYLQFAPLVTQLGIKSIGVEGSSNGWGHMLLGNALAYGAMLGTVHLGKTATRVLRPDGSAYKSFPSGHTAMAFTSATLLHIEYGGRYPWLSALGYASATAVGVGRMLNNRHWVGDVVTGAALGYACGMLGTWLSDRLLGVERSSDFLESNLIHDRSLSLYLPLRYASQLVDGHKGLRLNTTSLGIGLRWQYSPRGYYITGEFAPSLYQFIYERETTALRALSLSLGWGYDFDLWRKHLYLGIGSHFQVDLPLSSKHNTPSYLGDRPILIPKIVISPRWMLNARLGISLDLAALYRHSSHTQSNDYKDINDISLELGSSIWLRL